MNKQAEAEGSNTDDARYAELTTQFAVLHSITARFNGNFEEAGLQAERALSQMPEDLPPQISVQLNMLIYLALASAYEGSGDLEKAVGAYREIIRYSQLSKTLTGLGITIRLSGALRVLGRLREAEKICRDVLEFTRAQGLGSLPAGGVLHVALGEVLVEQNDLKAAEDHIAQGIETGEVGRTPGRGEECHLCAVALAGKPVMIPTGRLKPSKKRNRIGVKCHPPWRRLNCSALKPEY